ncbi:hypothetical protein ACJJTC_009101 [Scirpophaga incertulas]
MCVTDPDMHGAPLMLALSCALKGQASVWLSQVSFHGMTWSNFKDLFTARYESAETAAGFLIICKTVDLKIGLSNQDGRLKTPTSEKIPSSSSTICFSCGAAGHFAKNCRRSGMESNVNNMAGPSQEKRVNVCHINAPAGMLRHAGEQFSFYIRFRSRVLTNQRVYCI